jgi:hypothetical protein
MILTVIIKMSQPQMVIDTCVSYVSMVTLHLKNGSSKKNIPK